MTHNRDEAYRLCREMIVMDSGEVLRAGTTKEVFADPRTRAAARLTGCKNILPLHPGGGAYRSSGRLGTAADRGSAGARGLPRRGHPRP